MRKVGSKHQSDFSVGLVRPHFMLVSEKNRMKVHTNQRVLTVPYPLKHLTGAICRGQTMAPEAAEAFLVLYLTQLSTKMYS